MAYQPFEEDFYDNQPLAKIDDPAWCMKCDNDIAFCSCLCEECGASMFEDCNPGGDICHACEKKDRQPRARKQPQPLVEKQEVKTSYGPAGIFSTDNPQSDRMQILAESYDDSSDDCCDRCGQSPCDCFE